MKRINIIIVILFIGFTTFSQNLELAHNEEVVSNSEIDYTGGLSNDIKLIFNISNNSESSIAVKVRRRIIDEIEGTYHTFCLSECYPPEVNESTNQLIIDAGQTTGPDDFYIEFSPQGNQGNSVVVYEVFNVDDEDDNVTITINFNITLTGLELNDNSHTTLNAYPNPVSGSTVSINYDFVSTPNNAKLLVHNILGVEMKTRNLQQSAGRLTLDIDDLPKGIYLYSLENNGRKISTKRFVKRD